MARDAIDLWAALGPRAPIGPRQLDAWRVVESQHLISTRKLVDTLAEQEALEELIDTAKPPPPSSPEFQGLHYLLFTPFRYPPLRYGSRFGRAMERGIWYGSLDRQTALAERAYYKLLFLDGNPRLGTLSVPETVFSAATAAARFLDLTGPPFNAHEATISSPSAYQVSQALGSAMREAGVQGFAFVSARARVRGHNIGLFEPAFGHKDPLASESWICTATVDAVEFRWVLGRASLVYPRRDFLVKGELPRPAV